MIRFFRINDPLRLLVIILFLLIVRISYVLSVDFIFEPELLWMLLGEKMSNGSTVYLEIDDLTSVFSALTYSFLDLISGRSQLAHAITAIVFLAVQVVVINGIINRFSLLNERNYLIGFIYAALACCTPDFMLLSPDLMGTTFLIAAIYFLFEEMREARDDDNLLAMGWCLGFAITFNIHFVYFFFMFFAGLLLFSTLNARKIALLLIGMLLPYGLVSVYYILNDGFGYFFYESVFYALILKSTKYLSIPSFFLLILIPLIFGIVSILRVYSSQGYVNFKVRCQSVFLFWIICGIISGILNEKQAWYNYFSLIVPFSYFISGYFIALKKKVFILLLPYIFTLSCLYFGFHPVLNNPNNTSFIKYDRLVVSTTDTTLYPNVLNIGNDYSIYLNNPVGSRFLNWKISKQYFNNMDYVNMVVRVYEAFEEESPSVIHDPDFKMKDVFYRIPQIDSSYTKINDSTYVLNTIAE